MQTALGQEVTANERYSLYTEWQTTADCQAVGVDQDAQHSSPVLSPLTPPASVQVHQGSYQQWSEPHHRSEVLKQRKP